MARPRYQSFRAILWSELRWIRAIGLSVFSLLVLLLLVWFLSGMKQGLLSLPFIWREILSYLFTGMFISVVASVVAWPFALAIVSVMEQSLDVRFRALIERFFSFLSTLPLIFYGFVSLLISEGEFPHWIEKIWLSYFASVNPLTQVLAFAMTIILYPFRVVPGLGTSLTVDEFYQHMLQAVLDSAEVGLVLTTLITSLVFYVLPQFVVAMLDELRRRSSYMSFEVIQSLGGTRWGATQMTVLQTMRSSFASMLTRFTRLCFFEGLIALLLLRVFAQGPLDWSGSWSQTLPSFFLSAGLENSPDFIFIGLILGALFLTFLYVEHFFAKREVSTNG